MNISTRSLALLTLLLGLALAPATFAQSTLISEDFTNTTSTVDSNGVGNWLFFNGACLTAGTNTSLTPPAASIPAQNVRVPTSTDVLSSTNSFVSRPESRSPCEST